MKGVPAANDPLVSIVVTSYNGETYIAAQLDSILQQSYRNLEIIVCDDNSSDSTPAIIATCAENDPRVAVLHQTANIGLNRNLEAGLRAARGEYIAIADQDDIWHSNKIEKLLGNIGNHVAAFSDSELIDQNGRSLGRTLLESLRIRDPQAAASPLRLLKKNCVSGHALLFHRRLIDLCLPFDERMLFDRHLAIAAAVAGGIYFHPQPLVQHRMHQNNHTNTRLLGREAPQSLPADHATETVSLAGIREKQYESFRFRFELIARLLQQQTPPDTIPQADFFMAMVDTIVTLMAREKNAWFRFRLLFALWRLERHYHLFGFRRVVRLCKGKGWYTVTESLAMRINRFAGPSITDKAE